MTHPDDLLVAIAAMVESRHSSQMSLTVVIPGAVITGRLAPEALWKERVAEVLRDSEHLRPFAAVFTPPQGDGDHRPGHGDGPTHLHFHVARILQGSFGIPDTGGMYRVALKDVSAWTIGDIGYSDQ
ncbi:hypothetical protein ACM01_37060 [Streptomyces viridochromogenes]|uniref:Uncharacterized protein n=1 Tax=Streptomyces viridochromogenes TaxID=1938 RepID=A0A0J7Z0Q5_STRVR|nr:hypothetical protein [Streptomyces viridochromogenes]KMS68893.1 hypothetical protein ACM01_37060 [Streptomyces viridochromogenes]KOG11396.1 hypothetical protein ADK36_36780 [Streptomyces viridochromogenes]KOG11948.1 hypothetical protein ADK35_35135 [Streptomyces viridochromogenes]